MPADLLLSTRDRRFRFIAFVKNCCCSSAYLLTCWSCPCRYRALCLPLPQSVLRGRKDRLQADALDEELYDDDGADLSTDDDLFG